MSAPRSRKVSAQRVQTSVRTRFNPIKGLTPEKLGRALDAFDTGDLKAFARIQEKIRRRDSQISSVTGKRERAVSLLDYEIIAADDSPEAVRHQEALTYLYNNLSVGHADDRNQSGGVSLLIKQMMRAVGDKYACHELVWQPQPTGESGPRMTCQAVYIPLWYFENTTGELRFLQADFGTYGSALEEDGWMITVGDGLMEATAVAYIFKNLSLKDWSIYSEKFGLPGIHGKTDAAYGSEDWDRFVEAVKEFGNDFAMVTNLTGEVKELAFGAKGTLPFPQLVDYMDRALSILWRGGDLSTMSKDGGAIGSNAQDEETDAIAEGDAKLVSETLNEQIDKPAIRHLFGTDQPLAFIKIKPKARPNISEERDTDAFLIDRGIPISQADLAERYGRKAAAAGDAIASKSAAGPAVPFANENALKGRDAVFKANALEQLSSAQRKTLQPLIDRLEQVAGIEDETAQDAALTKLQNDLPRLYRQILGDPALAAAFEEILGSAIVDGAASAAAKQKSSQ